MTERHKHADVLIAIAEGRVVQRLHGTKWIDELFAPLINPLSFPDYEWRVKPEPLTVWVNIYHDNDFDPPYGYKTKDEADKRPMHGRIACVQVTYTPGDGL